MNYVDEIIKILDRVAYRAGRRPHELFSQWLAVVDATLAALPGQLLAVARTGKMAPDSPEQAAVFRRFRQGYEGLDQQSWRQVQHGFAGAFSLLLLSAEAGLVNRRDSPDVVGQVYMAWANTDPSWQAQYFTPWEIALMMAEMTISDGERAVYDRIKQAVLHPENVAGQAVVLAGGLVTGEGGQGAAARRHFFRFVLPAAMPFYEPVTINDPCCGSGIMFLAAATRFPDWANRLGLVAYFGQDIDPDCALMARINTRLYGLNGYGGRLDLAAVEALTGERPGQEEILKAAGTLAKGGKDGRQTTRRLIEQLAA